MSLVSFGFCRVGRSAGSAAQACWPISPAVHGKWRDVPAGAAGVAQCAVHDYRKCQALLSAREDYREFADSGAGATDLVCGNPVSGVADVAGGYGTRESGSCADALGWAGCQIRVGDGGTPPPVRAGVTGEHARHGRGDQGGSAAPGRGHRQDAAGPVPRHRASATRQARVPAANRVVQAARCVRGDQCAVRRTARERRGGALQRLDKLR